MSRYNTLNPLDSNNAKDLDDNAKNLDQYANSEAETFRNRFGVEKKTLAGLERSLAGVLSQVSPEVTLAAGQLDVTVSDFNASLSVYYIDGVRLSYPTDYTYADTATEQITLTKTRPAGSIIIATAIDPSGSGLIASSNQFASLAAAAGSTGLAEGDLYEAVDVGARFLVLPIGSPTLVGDITNSGGQVLQLQPAQDGSFNVKWFGALPDTANTYIQFDLAAQRALQAVSVSASGLNLYGPVRVPPGNWLLSQAVPTQAYWFLEPGAEMVDNPNWGNSNSDNLSFLTGRVFQTPARNAGGSLQLGATDLTWINDIRPTILGTSELQVVSATGEPGALFATRTSDNPSATEGTIGVKCYVANDKEGAGKTVGYGQYKESIRWPDAGTTFCEETNITTYGDLEVLYPGSVPGNALGVCVNYWIGGPVGSGPLSVDKAMTSAGIAFGGGSAEQNGKNVGFDAGIVFTNKAFETSVEKEIFRSGRGMKWALYSDGATRKGYIEGVVNQTSFNGQYNIMVREGTGEERVININPNSVNPDDNQFSNGDATHRWTEVFAINSSINTSDRNEKEQETEIEQVLKEAALEVQGLIRKWKWKAAVKSKGDAARWHIGPIAQDVQQAFESRGVDPFEYGILGFDELLDENENPTGEVRMNIRHTELQYLIMAAEA